MDEILLMATAPLPSLRLSLSIQLLCVFSFPTGRLWGKLSGEALQEISRKANSPSSERKIMNDRDQRRYDRATRVQTFGRDNATDFAAGSKATTLFASLDGLIVKTED